MGLQIVKDADVYSLPGAFCLTDLGFNKRVSISGKAYADGGVNRGDSKVGVRYFQLDGVLWGANDSAYDTKWDALILKLSQEDFYLRDGDWQILIHQAHVVEHAPERGLRKRQSEISFKLVALNPFWYHITQSSKEEVCSSMPHEFTVNNTGNYSIYPVITVTASANNPTMSLKNKTDDDALFSYEDIGFLDTHVLIVNCQEGTVERETIDTIRYFDGQFLRLLPGNNTIEYDGADATVKFEWYRRKL